MKRSAVLLLIAANLAVGVALAFIYPHLMVSPGPLVAAHGNLRTDCFACHAPWRGAASVLCIDCHRLPDIGLRTTEGTVIARSGAKRSFHQDLIEQDCMACHSDHLGPGPTTRSRRVFSHALLRGPVRERCDSCHQAPRDRLHRQISGNCQSCHVTARWKPASFEHGKHFVLDRDHDVACATCHLDNDYARYTCYGCHEHRPDKVREEHEEEGITNFQNCVECHRNADEEPRRPGGRKERERD